MEQIRILLVDMPQLVRQMIDRAIAAQEDMQVVATTADRDELVQAARLARPNFVIVGLDGAELSEDCLRVLDEQPRLKVLGIEADAGHAYLWELRPRRRALGEVAPSDVVETIRSAAAPVRG